MGIKCERCGTFVAEGDQFSADEFGYDDVCADCYDQVAVYDDYENEDEDESAIWDGDE